MKVTQRVHVVALIMLASSVCALCLWKVHQRHQVVRLGFELSEARENLRRMTEMQSQLRLEESTLTNPARIERLARAMGMDRPQPSQLEVVRKNRKVAVRK